MGQIFKQVFIQIIIDISRKGLQDKNNNRKHHPNHNQSIKLAVLIYDLGYKWDCPHCDQNLEICTKKKMY